MINILIGMYVIYTLGSREKGTNFWVMEDSTYRVFNREAQETKVRLTEGLYMIILICKVVNKRQIRRSIIVTRYTTYV